MSVTDQFRGRQSLLLHSVVYGSTHDIPLFTTTLISIVIAEFMKRMIIDAKLCQFYSKHCTRATACMILGDVSFDHSGIINICTLNEF